MTDTATTEVEANPPAPRTAKIKAEVTKLKGEAGTKARSVAEEGKAKAAETLTSVSRATREAAEKLKGSQAEPFAGYVESAAESIDNFAERMRSRSVDDLVDDVREMVRRSPVLVIGIAAAAGFILSRFLRASSRRDDDWA